MSRIQGEEREKMRERMKERRKWMKNDMWSWCGRDECGRDGRGGDICGWGGRGGDECGWGRRGGTGAREVKN